MRIKKYIVLAVAVFSFAAVQARTTEISLTELEKATKSAQPGDTLLVKSGTYNDVVLKLTGRGTAQSPVVVMAARPGEVVIGGVSCMKLSGEWLVVSGLNFKNGTTANGSPVIEFRNGAEAANNCRVTECVVDSFNPKARNENYSYVHLYGRNNRFDHNSLLNKLNIGVTLIVMLNQERDRQNFHNIDHNYFGRRPVYGSNGAETIRVGTSQQGDQSSNTVIEQNFFEQCNGEVEVISLKSCDNVVRKNVFFECEGVVALRHGDRNIAEDNLFVGNGIRNTGGVRVVNAGHIVRRNTFYQLGGERFFSALALMNAVPNSLPNRYSLVTDILIEDNTFVECREIGFGVGRDEERTLPPEKVVFAGNTIYNPKADHIFNAIDDIAGFTFRGNVTTAPRLGAKSIPAGFKVAAMKQPALPPYPVERSATGATWHDKGGAMAYHIEGRVIRVAAGQDALVQAVEGSSPNDIIELFEVASYPVSRSVDVKHRLVIRPVKGLDGKPEIRYNGSKKQNMITICDGGDLEISGIAFNGDLEPGKVLAGGGISTATEMIQPYSLTVDDCEFHNFTEGGFFAISGRKNTFAEKITVRNCVFNSLSGNAIDYAGERDDIGRYNADDIVIENCSFHRLLGIGINIYRGGSDESTAGPYVTISHCTFEDVCNQERGSTIRLIGPQVLVVRDCNFSNSGRGGAAIRLNEASWEKVTVENCNFWNSGRILTMTDKVVKGELFNIKPEYRNAAKLDLRLLPGSPLAGKKIGIR